MLPLTSPPDGYELVGYTRLKLHFGLGTIIHRALTDNLNARHFINYTRLTREADRRLSGPDDECWLPVFPGVILRLRIETPLPGGETSCMASVWSNDSLFGPRPCTREQVKRATGGECSN